MRVNHGYRCWAQFPAQIGGDEAEIRRGHRRGRGYERSMDKKQLSNGSGPDCDTDSTLGSARLHSLFARSDGEVGTGVTRGKYVVSRARMGGEQAHEARAYHGLHPRRGKGWDGSRSMCILIQCWTRRGESRPVARDKGRMTPCARRPYASCSLAR
jgi:hypothetical protein